MNLSRWRLERATLPRSRINSCKDVSRFISQVFKLIWYQFQLLEQALIIEEQLRRAAHLNIINQPTNDGTEQLAQR